MSCPQWLQKQMPDYTLFARTKRQLAGVNTVCSQALCPNIMECYSGKHAAFLILGSNCTRNCRFCNVRHGVPDTPDENEPARVAQAARALGLEHVVVTSVSRDDLPDGGALQFARTILALRQNPGTSVEVLVPDFNGREASLHRVLAASPDVLAHNLETVSRLQALIRPQADYQRSLWLLRKTKEMNGRTLTKSGLMLGLGEEDREVLEAMADLRAAGCDILTLGQYRQPGPGHAAVERFVLEEGFAMYLAAAEEMGFSRVFAGSYVRSSYRAGLVRELLGGAAHA
jgi:lipoyl synthase